MNQKQVFQPTPAQQARAVDLLIAFDSLCDEAWKKAEGDEVTMMEIIKIIRPVLCAAGPMHSLELLEVANEKLKMYQ